MVLQQRTPSKGRERVPEDRSLDSSAGGEGAGGARSRPRHSTTEGPGGVSRVGNEVQARALYEDVVRPDRVYPIVGLSCPFQQSRPPLAPEQVREVIWPTVPIYIIESSQARFLSNVLPDEMGAYNGAIRIWFPGVDSDSEARWHPLIYDSTGTYGEPALARIAAVFAHRPPASEDRLVDHERDVLRLRSLPRPAAAGEGDPGVGLLEGLATRKDLRRLVVDLRRAGRDYPIVVLTFRETEGEPAFDADQVRARLAAYIPVYVLGTADLCRRLPQSIGQHLAVDRGDARIFWFPLDEDSDAGEHPLVPARSQGDGRNADERLIAEIELSRPAVRVHVADLQERASRAERQATEHLRELRETLTEREDALARAADAEAAWEAAEQQLDALRAAGVDAADLQLVAGMDTETNLHRLMSREWLRALPSPDDRQRFPLGGYVFAPGFVKSVESLTGTTPERIAWVCAMVASGRAKELPGLEPHQLRSGQKGSAEPMVREDGAKAWICRLLGEGASRLQYWVTPSGVTEFAAATTHNVVDRL